MVDEHAPGRAKALAEELSGTLEDRFLSASGVRVRGPLVLRRVVLDELSICGLKGIGPVVISDCRFGTLRLTDVVVREGVVIEDCEISNLDIRGARTSAFSIVRNGIRRSVLHACGSLVLDSTTITELASISDIQLRLEIGRCAVGSMRLSADGPTEVTEVSISATTIRDRLDIVGLDAERLRLHDVAAVRGELRHVRLGEVELRELSIERDLAIQDVTGRGQPTRIELGGVIGSATIVTSDARGADIALYDATIRGDLTLGGGGDAELGAACTIEGVLRAAQGTNPTRVHLAPGASVRAIQPPATPVRTPAAAREAARAHLGGAGTTELAILRDSLRERPDEQDMAYFALRAAEQDEKSGIRRATMWLRGQLFGWGVTFLHPLRTLCAAVLMTAIVLFALNPAQSRGPFGRAVNALTSALGLWFNVGTGMPKGLDGPGWALAAVGCTALGIAIIAVITGVAIRRLTR